MATATSRPALRLDDDAITWRPFQGYDGLSFWVLGVNEERQQVDILFRLEAGKGCPPHRHVGPTDTLVVEGEHRVYERDGDRWLLHEVRLPGAFAANEGDHLHREEGGPEGAIVHLSMTAVDGVIWETWDDDGALVSVSTVEDFGRALTRQSQV